MSFCLTLHQESFRLSHEKQKFPVSASKLLLVCFSNGRTKVFVAFLCGDSYKNVNLLLLLRSAFVWGHFIFDIDTRDDSTPWAIHTSMNTGHVLIGYLILVCCASLRLQTLQSFCYFGNRV